MYMMREGYDAVKALPGVELVDRGTHAVEVRFAKVRIYEAKSAPR